MIITNLIKSIDYLHLINGVVLLIDKDKGRTSFDVIKAVRNKLKVKKVGHAGTLDPAATGLLIVCTGKKTKEINKYQSMTKVYEGIIKLGIKTPSMDNETEPIYVKDVTNISEDEIKKAVEKFVGEIEQVPPMYSAIKYKGKSLYKYARKGIIIKREPRKVSIYDFKIKKIELPEIFFEIICSKGTYIRVIANDLGDSLGCGAILSKLIRKKIGDYSVNDALSMSELNEIEILNYNNLSYVKN